MLQVQNADCKTNGCQQGGYTHVYMSMAHSRTLKKAWKLSLDVPEIKIPLIFSIRIRIKSHNTKPIQSSFTKGYNMYSCRNHKSE